MGKLFFCEEYPLACEENPSEEPHSYEYMRKQHWADSVVKKVKEYLKPESRYPGKEGKGMHMIKKRVHL